MHSMNNLPNKLKNKTILIVDDIESCYCLLDSILKRLEVNTIWADSGQEAIRICKENDQIDLALMDVRMPNMSGYEASKEIKNIRPKLPIIIQTAFGFNDEREKALAAGCDEYISKPINKVKLIQLLEQFL